MSKLIGLSAAALALAASAAFGQTAAPQVLTLPAALTLDGYCDGFTDITASRKTYSATYDAASVCGEFTAPAGGPIGRNLPNTGVLQQGVVLTAETYQYLGLTVSWIINADNTFTVTDTLGRVLNRGTWTAVEGARPTVRGGQPSYRQ